VLGQDFYEQVVPLKQRNLAYAVSWTGSALDRSWGRFGTSTISLVDVDDRRARPRSSTAPTIASCAPARREVHPLLHRRPVLDGRHGAPDGRQHHQGDRDVVRRSRVGLDRRPAPWFGVGGWTSGDARSCSTTSSTSGKSRRRIEGARLTDGAAEQTEYRVADSIPDAIRSIARSRSISR
jgi:hypothetical protein